ncbi:type II toxin-antitoxin system antitoxin SocA domain-containing protein [Mycoplasma procyoni]|uniref:type II toxin-antitoxin system antitoxin SocA domain-containing protein n=1 Tax=Mycoplasma procyoni TaxID=568784 RepID=UPI00197C9F8C|nr:type II toxin-antitoxin system antitoxin SocA domain-containing protein [Mycoplasma procyoni]MBN3534715.1 DUF4065 domain-containing protein [Mycoplasma procyoni]
MKRPIDVFYFMKYLLLYSKIKDKNYNYWTYKTWQQKVLWFSDYTFLKQNKTRFFDSSFLAYFFGPIEFDILNFQYLNDNKVWYTTKENAWNYVFWDPQQNMNVYYKKSSIKLIEELKEEFLKEFNNDQERWDHFTKIADLCFKFRPYSLTEISHKHQSWKNAEKEKREITTQEMIDDTFDPIEDLKQTPNYESE